MVRIARALFQFLIVRLRGLWAGLLLPAALFGMARLGWVPGATLSDRISGAGIILSLAGLVGVAYGYTELRSRFGRPKLGRAIANYFSDFWAALRKRPQDANVAISGVEAESKTHGVTVLTRGPPTLETRVEDLERTQKELQSAFTTFRDETTQKHNNMDVRFTTAHSKLTEMITQHRVLLEKVTLGGMSSEVAGWIWLLFATLFSGVPDWLASRLS
jgi:hypothetical protein